MESTARMLRKTLDPGWLTGPIFGKELRVASRRRRQYALRVLYILALTVFAGVVWLSVVQYQGSAAFIQSRMAEAGKKIITTIVFFQFVVMQVLAVVLLSSAISDEIYHRTLGTLMTTPINSFQIVVGKVLSRLLQLLLLLAISLPMLAIVRVLGGVPWGYLLASLCITLTASLFAGSVSLLFSIKNLYAYGVIMRTLFVLACLYLGAPALLGAIGFYLGGTARLLAGSGPGGPSLFGQVLISLNPFSAMAALTGQMLVPGAPTLLFLPLHCGIMLGFSALVLGRAVTVVRRVALRQAVGERPEDRRRKKKKKKAGEPGDVPVGSLSAVPRSPTRIRRVVGPPVIWKELRAPFIQGIDSRNSYIGLAMAILALVLTYIAGASTRSLDSEFTHTAYVMLFVFIGVLVNIVFSATQITTEKETQSWSLLLATSLSDRDILLGKAISAFRRCLPIWGLLAGHMVLFTLAGYIHPVAALHLLVVVGWLTCFLTGAGLYFSSRFSRTTSAVVATFGLVVGLWVVGPTLAGLLGVMGAKNDVFAAYMWTHPAAQTQMILGATANSQNARLPWKDLTYGAGFVSRSDSRTLHAGTVTYVLLYIATAYCLAGFLFYWRAKHRLRQRVFE